MFRRLLQITMDLRLKLLERTIDRPGYDPKASLEIDRIRAFLEGKK